MLKEQTFILNLVVLYIESQVMRNVMANDYLVFLEHKI